MHLVRAHFPQLIGNHADSHVLGMQIVSPLLEMISYMFTMHFLGFI